MELTNEAYQHVRLLQTRATAAQEALSYFIEYLVVSGGLPIGQEYALSGRTLVPKLAMVLDQPTKLQ